MQVGERIIQLRTEQNISTNKLANLAGISQSFLREVELGKKNMTTETLSYICYALNISLSEFFKENSDEISAQLLTALKKLSLAEQNKLAEFINELKK